MSECCPVCGGELRFVIRRRDRYAYYRCGRCTHVTALPRPTEAEVKAFYDGFLFGRPSDRQFERRQRQVNEDVRRVLADLRERAGLVTRGRLLDWGGGTGFYANALAANGFDVTLMDLDAQSTAYAAEMFPGRFRIVTGDPADCASEEKYDVIHCCHVVEHYVDLDRFMARFRDLLVPGGVAIVTTPNQQCKEFLFRLDWLLRYLRMAGCALPAALYTFLRRPWICCDPPRHMHAFNRGSLRCLFERHGFEVIACFSESAMTQYYASGRYRPDWQIRRPLSLLRLPMEVYALAGLTLVRALDRNRLT